MERINNLIKYFDTIFYKEKVHIHNGSISDHYSGLIFDYYFDNSIYSIDYINVYDYFSVRANFYIEEEKLLYDQIEGLSIEKKILVIESILNLLNKTSYDIENNTFRVKKINSILEQCGFHVVINDEIKIYLENVKFHGSYCEIVEISPTCYKKRLQKKYSSIYQWQLRMKREYENLKKLENSKYILKAYEYQPSEHAFTMEVCDSNLADDFEHLDEKQIEYVIHDILNGMNDVHQQGIIHRDLHLGNILRKNNNYVLSDFGLSKDTMVNIDYKSSNTPKNSHMFMDPAAKDDFNKLDKLTDIYSIGKIIEYLVASKSFANNYKFIISKATNSNRNIRYQNVNEIIIDFNQIIQNIKKEKTRKAIIDEIINGKYNEDTSSFILNLLKESIISKFIVEHKLYNFGEIILAFDDDVQNDICKNIENNYIEATGYNGWENYDIFGAISKYLIDNSKLFKIRKTALSILKGCANYRFYYYNELENVKVTYPELF